MFTRPPCLHLLNKIVSLISPEMFLSNSQLLTYPQKVRLSTPFLLKRSDHLVTHYTPNLTPLILPSPYHPPLMTNFLKHVVWFLKPKIGYSSTCHYRKTAPPPNSFYWLDRLSISVLLTIFVSPYQVIFYGPRIDSYRIRSLLPLPL